MTQKATPNDHSTFVGGSTASRRLNCTMSLIEERRAKEMGLLDKSSEYAKEGTFCHDMSEFVMTGKIEPSQIDGYKRSYPAKGDDAAYEYVGSVEEADLVVTATDALDDLFDQMEEETGKPVEVMYEQSGFFPGLEDKGARGTADIIARSGDLMLIGDYKFGRGEVEVEENSQLLFYACAMRYTWPKLFDGVEHVCLAIIQPKLKEEAQTWWATPEDLDQFEADLVEAMRVNESGKGDWSKGPWCKFAKCQAICPLHTGAAAAVAMQAQMVQDPPTKDFDTGAFLSDAMELAEMAEEWAKVIRSIAHDRLDNGQPVPGWKTVAKRSSGRDWIKPEEEVVEGLLQAGLDEDTILPTKLISVAQAEKELKKIGSHVTKFDDGWAEKRPSSGTTLTRDGDPRDEALAPAAKAAMLGEQLGKMLEQKD